MSLYLTPLFYVIPITIIIGFILLFIFEIPIFKKWLEAKLKEVEK